jgi:hypothetical protein
MVQKLLMTGLRGPQTPMAPIFQLGVGLAVAAVLLIVLAATHLEDAHLVVLAVRHHGGLHAGAGHQGSPDLQVAPFPTAKDLVDHDLLAHVRSNLFYLDLFAGSNLVLLATGFYDRVHVCLFGLFTSIHRRRNGSQACRSRGLTHERTRDDSRRPGLYAEFSAPACAGWRHRSAGWPGTVGDPPRFL